MTRNRLLLLMRTSLVGSLVEKTKVEESERELLKIQNRILTEEKYKAEEEIVKLIAENEKLRSRINN